MTRVAVVLVHYHTAELAVRACEALAADLAGAGVDAEWVIVDNGSSAAEREVLATLSPRGEEKGGARPARLVEPGENLGYAGGANLGVRETRAENVFLMNADVEVLPGCSAALLDALDGVAAAGPKFYWDAGRTFLLPVNERRTRRDEFLRVLAERHTTAARWARRRWRRHAGRFWTASGNVNCHELSGAFLAFRRDAWEAVGGFDEGYALYFEETDFLERLRRRGLQASFVPAAEAVHLYAQSTVGEPRSEGWFAESQRRFFERHYGRGFTRLLTSLAAAWPPRGVVLPAVAAGEPAWLDLSASPLGFPATRLRAEGRVELPAKVQARVPPGTWYLWAVDAAGRELGGRRLVISARSHR